MSEHQARADALAEKYIRLRDFKDKVSSELKEKVSKIDSVMESLEMEMMTFLNQTGMESAKTPTGTFFKKTSTSAKVADWDVALNFIVENEMFQMLERRVSKTAVEEYIATNGAVPPGVDVVREVSIGVNRPKNR